MFDNQSSGTPIRIHPEKYAFNIGTPGTTQFNGGERGLMIVLLLFFFAGGVSILVAMSNSANEDMRLNQTGAQVQAQVSNADANGSRYFITYQFYAESGPFEGTLYYKRVRVSRELYDQISTIGTTIQVQYDANNPATSDIVIADRMAQYRFGVIVGGVFIFGVVAVAWWWLDTGRRQHRYRTRGTIIPAEVMEHEVGGTDSNGHLQVNLKYKFDSPSGKHIERSEVSSGTRWDTEPLLSPGTRFEVIYVDDRNFRVL